MPGESVSSVRKKERKGLWNENNRSRSIDCEIIYIISIDRSTDKQIYFRIGIWKCIQCIFKSQRKYCHSRLNSIRQNSFHFHTVHAHAHAQVFMDGGVRTGTDVFKAIALGAHFVFIGRPIIHGLAVGVSLTSSLCLSLSLSRTKIAWILDSIQGIGMCGIPRFPYIFLEIWAFFFVFL